MRKADQIDQIAQQTGVSKVDVLITVVMTLDVIKHPLAAGESIFIRGFGTFSPKHRAAKVGRNFKRGLPVELPAHNIPHFKPAAEFKAELRRLAGSLERSEE